MDKKTIRTVLVAYVYNKLPPNLVAYNDKKQLFIQASRRSLMLVKDLPPQPASELSPNMEESFSYPICYSRSATQLLPHIRQ